VDMIDCKISGSCSRAIYGNAVLGTFRIINCYIRHAAAQNVIDLTGTARMIARNNDIEGAAGVTAGIYFKDSIEAIIQSNHVRTLAEAYRIECVSAVSDFPKIYGNFADTVSNGIRLIDTVDFPMTIAYIAGNTITNATASLTNSAGATIVNAIGIAIAPVNTNAVPANSNRAMPVYDSAGKLLGYVPVFTAAW